MDPEVSVIIPVYNRSETISRCLDSVLDQTYENIEVIVVDDNSTDDTIKQVQSYDDSMVKLVCHEHNRGAPAARNTGIKNATGEYIAFLDSDDVWSPHKISYQVNTFAEAGESIGVVYCGYYAVSNGEKVVADRPTENGDIYLKQLFKDHVNPTSTVMVRKECLEKVGLFNTKLPSRQDYDLWIRLSEHFGFESISKPLVEIHTDSKNRITDDIQARLAGSQKVLENVRERAREFDLLTRRRILASQHYSIGRYLFKRNQRSLAKVFLMRSLRQNPFHWKSIINMTMILLGLSEDRIKSRIGRIRGIMR